MKVILLLVCLLISGSKTYKTGELMIYDDYLSPDWKDASNTTTQYKSSELAFDSQYSISFIPEREHIFALKCAKGVDDCLELDKYSSLNFYLFISSSFHISEISFKFYKASQAVRTIELSSLYPAVSSMHFMWIPVYIDFFSNDMFGQKYDMFSIEGGWSDSEVTIFVDNIFYALIIDQGTESFGTAVIEHSRRAVSFPMTTAQTFLRSSIQRHILGEESSYHEDFEEWLLSAFSLLIVFSVLGIVTFLFVFVIGIFVFAHKRPLRIKVDISIDGNNDGDDEENQLSSHHDNSILSDDDE